MIMPQAQQISGRGLFRLLQTGPFGSCERLRYSDNALRDLLGRLFGCAQKRSYGSGVLGLAARAGASRWYIGAARRGKCTCSSRL